MLNEAIWTEEPEWTRTTLKDIIDDKPGPTARCLNSESPLDCFNLFLDQEMRNIVINNSNLNEERRIDGLIKGNKKTKGFEPLNQTEFDAFMGITIALGALNQNSVDIHWIWSKKNSGFHFPFVRKAMTLTKFKKIRSMLRFDDKSTRDQRKKSDRLAAMREFNDKLQENCINNYNPEENLTIDERISPFHGRVGFKIFMKSKPHKYGLKIWMLCGATVRYVHNFQVYTGMIDGKREENQSRRVVLDMVQHLKSGYNVVTDSFFTSIECAQELLARKKITMVGVIRSNRKGILQVLKNAKGIKEFDHKFRFYEGLQLTSYSPKNNKIVLILSSHHPNTIVHGEDMKFKPDIILEYNESKCGVDVVDQIADKYSVQRKTRRWPLSLFYNYLNIIIINSYTVYESITKKKKMPVMNRREFMLSLSSSLINNFETQNETPKPDPLQRPSRNGRCELCPKQHGKKDTYYCQKCLKRACKTHLSEIRYCIYCNPE